MKTCPSCKQLLPLEDFYSNQSKKSGHSCYCKKCDRARINAAYLLNPENHRRSAKKRREKNPEKARQACRKWRKNNRKASRGSAREQRLKRYYGISLEQYRAMLTSQKGVCSICGGSKSKRIPVVHRPLPRYWKNSRLAVFALQHCFGVSKRFSFAFP